MVLANRGQKLIVCNALRKFDVDEGEHWRGDSVAVSRVSKAMPA
jgi:hypothetical protein